MKCCTKCGVEKPLDDFPARRIAQDGRGYKCRLCAAGEARAWRAANREAHRAYSKRWKRDNKEHAKRKALEWSAKNKDRRAKACREWNGRNQDKRAAAVARRRAKLVTPAWADRTAIAGFYRAAKIMEAETGVKHHVDHIVPLNSPLVCGLHVEHNLKVIPARENVLKRNLVWPDMP